MKQQRMLLGPAQRALDLRLSNLLLLLQVRVHQLFPGTEERASMGRPAVCHAFSPLQLSHFPRGPDIPAPLTVTPPRAATMPQEALEHLLCRHQPSSRSQAPELLHRCGATALWTRLRPPGLVFVPPSLAVRTSGVEACDSLPGAGTAHGLRDHRDSTPELHTPLKLILQFLTVSTIMSRAIGHPSSSHPSQWPSAHLRPQQLCRKMGRLGARSVIDAGDDGPSSSALAIHGSARISSRPEMERCARRPIAATLQILAIPIGRVRQG